MCLVPCDLRLKKNWEDFKRWRYSHESCVKWLANAHCTCPKERWIWQDLWWLQMYGEPRTTSWAVSLTPHWRYLCKACWRAEILKDWPSSGIPQTRDVGRFNEIPHYQHAHGSVSVQQTDVRHHQHLLSDSAPLIKCWKEHLARLYPWRFDNHWQGWWRTPG